MNQPTTTSEIPGKLRWYPGQSGNILQQQWEVTVHKQIIAAWQVVEHRLEWRDVPVDGANP